MTDDELQGLRCRDHPRRHIETAWRLGTSPEHEGTRLCRWAHQLGYGGHCLTKSRRYSTTFKALREARALYAASRSTSAGESSAKSGHNLIRVSAWRYAGRGYPQTGDALLARSSHARGTRAPATGARGGDGRGEQGEPRARGGSVMGAQVSGGGRPAKLLLARAEAAELLSMSLNHFERYAQPNLRLARCARLRLVPVRELERWAHEQARFAA
jgi:replication initiator protein RepSA